MPYINEVPQQPNQPAPGQQSTGPLVDIHLPTGELGTVPESDLEGALAAGARLVTDEERRQSALQAQYGGTGSQVAAAGLGAARGATLGLSDLALTKLGGEQARSYAEGVKEANPTASTVGEGLGVLGSFIVPGLGEAQGASTAARGLGAAAKVAAAPLRAASGLGGILERGVAKVVGSEATGVLARGAQRGAQLAAQAGVENALMEAGSQLSEDVLGKHEITGEKLMAALGRGFVTGAEFGGPLGFASGAGGALVGKYTKRLGDELRGMNLRDKADEILVDAMGSNKPTSMSLGATAPEIAARRKELGATGREIGLGEAESKLEMAEIVNNEIGRRAAMLDLDIAKLPAKSMFDMSAPLVRIEREIIRPLTTGVDAAHKEFLLAKVQTELDSARKTIGAGDVTFEKARKWRQNLDHVIDATGGFDAQDTLLKNEEMRKFRAIVEEEIMNQGEKAAGVNGAAWLDSYKANKEVYSKLADIREILTGAATAEMVNQKFGIKDVVQGGALMNAAANIGGVAGSVFGPGGAVLGGAGGALAGGILGAKANQWARTTGKQTLASTLDKVSQLDWVKNVNNNVDKRIAKAVDDFVSKSAPLRTAIAGEVERNVRKLDKPRESSQSASARYNQVINTLDVLKTNPAAFNDRIERMVPQGVKLAAPMATASAIATAYKAVDYLNEHRPKSPQPRSFYQSHLEGVRQPAASDVARFMRRVDAINDPSSVLDSIIHGRVDREMIDAIKAVYPNYYSQIQQHMMRAVSQSKKKLSRSQLAGLSVVFGQPFSPSFSPESIQLSQDAYTADEAEGGSPGAQPSGGPSIDISSSFESPSDSIAS